MKKPQSGWTYDDIANIYQQPFNDLLFEAHKVHRENHSPNSLQIAQLLSIKTGACPEDCGYCSQSGHYKTHVEKEKLLPLEDIIKKAKEAKEGGASRFCMGAAWRSLPDKAFPQIKEMITAVKDLGLETCMTLGMLTQEQAESLKEAGLDFYNHNIGSSEAYYDKKVVSTHSFKDRMQTVQHVRDAGISVCCGGIVGFGETKKDRIEFLMSLANMETPPESVPINRLIPVEGTPLAKSEALDGFELVRTIATARIIMPTSILRLSAGRAGMSEELQALCYFVGASSVWRGDKLLTEENPQIAKDQELFDKLGLVAYS